MDEYEKRAHEVAQCVAIEMCADRSCGGCLCDKTLERVTAELTALVRAAVAEERGRAAEICNDACGRAEVCNAYTSRGRRCPECPGYLADEILDGGPATPAPAEGE